MSQPLVTSPTATHLGPHLIHNASAYETASFNRLRGHLERAGFTVCSDYTRLRQRLPRFDKFHWQPWRTVIPADVDNTHVKGGALIHQGMHHLAWSVAPGPMQGMSRSALLGEGIASAANLYFCFEYLNHFGIEHEYVQHELSLYREEADRQQLDLLTALNRGRVAPFSCFRTAVLELFELCLMCLEITAHSPGDPGALLPRVQAKVDTFETWPMISAFDYATFVLHTLWHCGPDSSARDQQAVEAILEVLLNARDFGGFLDGLDARRGMVERPAGAA